MIVDLDLKAPPNERRLAGLSTDKKPLPGDLDLTGNTNLESGATFLEVDKRQTFLLLDKRWWLMPEPNEDVLVAILSKLEEIQRDLDGVNGHLAVGSDLGSKEALEMARG